MHACPVSLDLVRGLGRDLHVEVVEHLAGGEAWGALRFWSHVPDAWRPEYELMAPLYAPDGELVGTTSLDRPRDGRIPPPWANELPELFAEQAPLSVVFSTAEHAEELLAQCGRAAGHDAPPGSRGSAALAGRDKANPVVVPGTPSARSAGCVGGGGSRGLPSGAIDDLLCHPV